LAPRRILLERQDVARRGEHLDLLRLQFGGREGDGLFHGDQGQELQQVVLDDIAGCADAVVVAGAAAQADILGHGDLDVVDVMGAPHRVEQLVREAQGQDVLDCFLTEIVVDAEH